MQAGMIGIGALAPSAALVVPACRWLVLPVPKAASTLLKRLAVIADGRDPASLAVLGETRPALAIHRPDLHGLPNLSELPADQRQELLSDPHALRLAVTRHPGERLLSFWHDKLHLADPVYAPLNGSIQASHARSVSEPCRFADFLAYLGDHWEQLRADGHLRPQSEWLGDGSLFNHRLDRADLLKALPPLLQTRLPAPILERIRQELLCYDQHHRQRLAKRWESSYGSEGFALLEHLYVNDLAAYGYELPRRRPDKVTPLVALETDALVNPLQQLRDRHLQIAGLQEQIVLLQQQLAEARQALQCPPLPALHPAAKTWPAHNDPGAGLAHLYEALGQHCHQEVLDQVAGLQHHPQAGEIAYLEGLAHSALGRHEQALRCFEAAQGHGFLTPYVLFNGGNACRALGNTSEGIRLYNEALAAFPDFVECRHNLALALSEAGAFAEAERQLRLLLRDQPSYMQASFCLANLLRDHHRDREAIEAFRLCLQFAPAFSDAWNNLGLSQASLGDLEQAMACYRQALSIDATFKPSRQNLAQALVQSKRHGEALEQFDLFGQLELSAYERVLALQGQLNCLLELGRYDDALALADAQADRRLQLMSRLHVLPVLYVNDEQVAAIRQRWADDALELYALLDGIDRSDPVWEQLYAHAWTLTNFYLAYQMENDRPLQELYAGILDRILRPRLGDFMQPLPQRQPDDSRPLRIGVISPHLHNHNGSIWCLGWLDGLAQDPRFEIFTYNLAERVDSGTQRFAALGLQRQLLLRAENPEPMLQQILNDELDLLLFTDIGMHPASKITSVLQLAPIQAQGWGHPITSGSRTMHYYLSGEGMEPAGNEEHYSETLVRLPRTGLKYETPAALHDGQCLYDQFDLPRDRPILTSLQSTFKYLPRNDWTFAEIAARNPQALIVLVGHMGSGSIADRLLERLRPHFEHRDLAIEQHLRILPRMDYGDFMGLFALAHHTIDTIDWNGGNSSMQSFSLDCPVVTLPTAYMRGRHTVSMLQVLEIPELVAQDRDDYVAISTRLLEDHDFYLGIKNRIRERKHLLFHDHGVAEAFRAQMIKLCSEQPTSALHTSPPDLRPARTKGAKRRSGQHNVAA